MTDAFGRSASSRNGERFGREIVTDALSTAFLVGGLDLARRYCAAHPETMALVTPDDGSGRPVVIGSYRGARVEEA